eukprot:6361694-Prymnesium_polylepis.1
MIDNVKYKETAKQRHQTYKELYTTLNGDEGRPGGRKPRKNRAKTDDDRDDDDEDDFGPVEHKDKDKKAGKEGKDVEPKNLGITDPNERKAYESLLQAVLQRELRIEYDNWKKEFELSLLSDEEK